MLENLDRLKVFYHVFKEGSIVAASKTLHVSQSAVSQALQKLERETGTPLFTRLHKQLVPTAAGKQLNDIVQPFMATLKGYLESQKKGKKYPAGELCIGAPPEFGKAYLPLIVADFRVQYPDVTFTLEFGSPTRLLPLLKQGALSFALIDVFLAQNVNVGRLDIYHFTPLVEEEVILACSKRYFDTRVKGNISAHSLAKLDFISYKKDQQAIRNWFRHHFSKPNIPINDVLTVNSQDAVITAIKKDIGLGIVASHLVKNDLREERILHIKPGSPEVINQIALVYLQDKVPTFTEKVFEKFLIKTTKNVLLRDY